MQRREALRQIGKLAVMAIATPTVLGRMAAVQTQENDQPRVIVIPKMPAEFISPTNLDIIAPGFTRYPRTGEVMKIMNTPLHCVGDWMGYCGWNMPAWQKDEDQLRAEEIMRRRVVALDEIDDNDRRKLASLGLSKYI